MVFIAAVENSADQLGAKLIEALRSQHGGIKICAIGGSAIKALGVESEVTTEGLSILGFTEALRAYPLVLKRVKETTAAILRSEANAAILIDSWGFMIRVSQRLKKAGFKGKIIKYVAPQVWAMREGRAKILAQSVDHLLAIHAFDAPYFEKHGLKTTHVGNPMFDTDFKTGDASVLRKALNLHEHQRVCALLFGSRKSELAQLRPVITEAAALLKARYPDLCFVSPVSETLRSEIMGGSMQDDMAHIHLVNEARKYDVFASAEIAIACSGTVTTQLASAGIPTVVTYRLKPLTWWVSKKLFKPDYISLINISAGQALMPELLQDDATAENLANAAAQFLDAPDKRASRSAQLMAEAGVMKGSGGSASESAARKILELIGA